MMKCIVCGCVLSSTEFKRCTACKSRRRADKGSLQGLELARIIRSDWEGPQGPEYSERDDEAFDEMLWQDAAGFS